MADKPLVENAADERQIKAASRRLGRNRQQELDDFKQIMSTQVGRRFLWRLLDLTGFQKTSFTGNSTTFFNEGQRNIGLILWADMNQSCPEMYVTMLNEIKEREAKE